MKNKSLIISIITLTLSFSSLVVSSFAWFNSKSNDESVVNNITAISMKIKSAELNKYKANYDINNDTYTKGEKIESDTVLNPYDPIFGYDKVIYEFEIIATEDVNANLFLFLTDAKKDKPKSYEVFYQNGACYNYLSNVGVFTYIDAATKQLDNDKKITLGYNEYNSNGFIINEVNLENGINYVQVLFDYNEENVTRLCSDNIGINVDTINFVSDIRFLIVEVQ